MRILCFLLALGAVYTLVGAQDPFYLKFQWNYVNYTWPSPQAYEEAKDQGLYVPRDNVVSSIKLYNDKIYLAIPRLKRGVPVTLASISATSINGNTAPLLEPFPSWDLQTVGNCDRLQSVQNMEIDPTGRMWVLDSGRVMDGSEESSQRACGASLRIFNLNLQILLSVWQLGKFDIPATVADPRSADLRDIVLDHEDGGMAYISDADRKDPGIIVFSLQTGTFWKVRHGSVFSKPEGSFYHLNNKQRLGLFAQHIHALALSPASTEGERTLYYSPLASLNLYSIPTSVLKNKAPQADIDSHVRNVGSLLRQTASMIMSNTGVLYYSEATDATIMAWDTNYYGQDTNPQGVTRDARLLQWPAAFAFDNKGSMWCLSNRMHLALNESMRIDEPNFRVLASNVSFTNYQYLEDGSVPPLPEIGKNSGAGLLLFNASLALAALLMFFMF